MKNPFYFLLLIPILFFISCDEESEDLPIVPQGEEVDIRFRNTSAYDYANVHLEVLGEETDYNLVAIGETTEYVTYPKAYRYHYIELEIDGIMHTIQPIDYVGESYLPAGNYTFEVDAMDVGTNQFPLIFTLVED